MKKWCWYLISIAVVVLDQASKYWVSSTLTAYTPMPICPMFNFTLAYNTGAAFSFLSGAGEWHRWFFVGFSFLVSCILTVWLWRTPAQQRLQSIGVSLILGGAIGNLIDRALYGYVVDFIDVYYEHHHFATFNLADTAISIGAGLLILDLIVNRDQS